jgi:hypothetical protein
MASDHQVFSSRSSNSSRLATRMRWQASNQDCQYPTLAVLLPLLQAVGDLLILREVAQLGDVVEHGLQIVVTDLALERRDQRAGFFCCVAAERACLSLCQYDYALASILPSSAYSHSHAILPSHPVQLTQLCPLKLGQLCQSLGLASDLLHRLAALKTRESRKVGVVLVDQVVVSERQLGVLGARLLNTSE